LRDQASEITRKALDDAYERLKNVYLDTSALKAVRIYSPKNTADLELWALFCAITDFQIPVIKWLIPMLSCLYEKIEDLGLKFIDLVYDPRQQKMSFLPSNGVRKREDLNIDSLTWRIYSLFSLRLEIY